MCVLMGLGLFASCAAVIRTLSLRRFYDSGDVFFANVGIALWAVIEQHFAVIAATIPTLKAFAERTLVRVGLFFYEGEGEVEMRGRLVRLGLLDAGDILAKDESVYLGKGV